MIGKTMDGEYVIYNPNTYFCHPMFVEVNNRRRSLFEQGIFRVEKSGEHCNLYINGVYVACWLKGDGRLAEIIIATAFRTYGLKNGAVREH